MKLVPPHDLLVHMCFMDGGKRREARAALSGHWHGNAAEAYRHSSTAPFVGLPDAAARVRAASLMPLALPPASFEQIEVSVPGFAVDFFASQDALAAAGGLRAVAQARSATTISTEIGAAFNGGIMAGMVLLNVMRLLQHDQKLASVNRAIDLCIPDDSVQKLGGQRRAVLASHTTQLREWTRLKRVAPLWAAAMNSGFHFPPPGNQINRTTLANRIVELVAEEASRTRMLGWAAWIGEIAAGFTPDRAEEVLIPADEVDWWGSPVAPVEPPLFALTEAEVHRAETYVSPTLRNKISRGR